MSQRPLFRPTLTAYARRDLGFRLTRCRAVSRRELAGNGRIGMRSTPCARLACPLPSRPERSSSYMSWSTDYGNALNRLITEHCKRLGLTREAFAHKATIGYATLKRAVAAKTAPAPDTLAQVSRALGFGPEAALYAKLTKMVTGRSVHPAANDLKSFIGVRGQEVSGRLLNRDMTSTPPTFLEALEVTDVGVMSPAQKDAGTIGEPAYNHFVQASVVLVLQDASQSRVVRYHRSSHKHLRTLGWSILFSSSLRRDISGYASPIDGWLAKAQADPHRAGSAIVVPDGRTPPLVMTLLRHAVRIPEGVESTVEAGWVVTNDQRGRQRGDTVMRTVYTSYVFCVRCRSQFPMGDAMCFRSEDDDRDLDFMPLRRPVVSQQEKELRKILSDAATGRENLMDVAVAMALSGSDKSEYSGDHGVVTIRNGFTIT